MDQPAGDHAAAEGHQFVRIAGSLHRNEICAERVFLCSRRKGGLNDGAEEPGFLRSSGTGARCRDRASHECAGQCRDGGGRRRHGLKAQHQTERCTKADRVAAASRGR